MTKIDHIPIVNSDYFVSWSGYRYLTPGRIARLIRVFNNYSYIVTNGFIEVTFLSDSDKHDLHSNKIFINTKNLFKGEIDLLIGEIIFNLIVKASLNKKKYSSILEEKFNVSDVVVTRDSNSLYSGNLLYFLTDNVVVDTTKVVPLTLSSGKTTYAGVLSTLERLPEKIETCEQNSATSLLQSIGNVSTDFKQYFGAVIKFTSYLLFLKRFFTVGDQMMKYCRVYIEYIVKNQEKNSLEGTLEDLIKVFICGEEPSLESVKDFIEGTKITQNFLHTAHEEEIIRTTYTYFEEVLNEEIQKILDLLPSVSNKIFSSLDEALSGGDHLIILNKSKLSSIKNNLLNLLFC